MSEATLSQLPAWAIFGLGVVWLLAQAAERIFKHRARRKSEEEIERYRQSRVPGSDPPPSFREDATGRHDVRALIEQDRTNQEILTLSRETNATLREIARSQAQFGHVLEQLAKTMQRQVELQEREQETHDHLISTQREMMRSLAILADHVETLPRQ